MKAKLCAGALIALLTLQGTALAQAAADQTLLQELRAIELQQDALKAKRAEIMEALRQHEEQLKADLLSIQQKITTLEDGTNPASLQRLASSVTLVDSSPPQDTAQATAETTGASNMPRQKETSGKKTEGEGKMGGTDDGGGKGGGDTNGESEDIKGWFLGAGLGTRFNLSGDRAEEVKFAELEDGSLIAQVAKSEDAEIRVLFESHYMFDNPTALNGSFWRRLESLASCGLWAFIERRDRDASDISRGCGPFVAVALDKDASPEEFALGHMLSLKRQGADRPFNLGYGIIIDPDSTTVDRDLFVKGSNQVKDEYVNNVKDGTLSLTTEEETIGFLLLFSTNF